VGRANDTELIVDNFGLGDIADRAAMGSWRRPYPGANP
jgi:hypothetical protein